MQLSSVFCNYIEHINWTKCSYPRTVSFDFMIIQQIHINQLSGKDIYYKDKYYTWQSCISSLLLTVTLSIDQSNKGVNVLNQMKRQIMKQQNKTYYNKQNHFWFIFFFSHRHVSSFLASHLGNVYSVGLRAWIGYSANQNTSSWSSGKTPLLRQTFLNFGKCFMIQSNCWYKNFNLNNYIMSRYC